MDRVYYSLILIAIDLIITVIVWPLSDWLYFNFNIGSSSAFLAIPWSFFGTPALLMISLIFGILGLESPKKKIAKIAIALSLLFLVISALMIIFMLAGFSRGF
jgi:hypothetical protein